MNINKVNKLFRLLSKYSELIFWSLGLFILAFSDPCQTHGTFCLFKLAGFHYCPGCGLGHSISFLFRGDFWGSFHSHPLGIPALIFILLRIYRLLLLNKIINLKTKKHGYILHEPSEP
ncbi:MAG: DUF2752 domain-containing protein [Bacteroidetes bacterium]|nr:DUF2752 domain-containing protein [Bacteroidota bacterium]